MKILMVNKFLYIVGGAETYAFTLGEKLKEVGNEVEYFGLANSNNIVSNKWNIYVKSYDDQFFFNPYKLIYSIPAKRLMKKILELYHPDIVHMNNISYHLTSSVIDACKEMGIPVVMTIHDSQLICPNHMLYRMGNHVCQECLDGNFKHCQEHKCVKGSAVKSYLAYLESKKTHEENKYSYIYKLICPSVFIASLLNIGGYRNTIVLRNFSDIVASQNHEIKKKNYILYFGRLSEEKGVNLLCDALPDSVNLKIVGDGPIKTSLPRKQNIEVLGYLKGQELQSIIQNALFTICSSVWFENCPMSVIESISYGTPVLAADAGGLPELIECNKTGLLFKRGSKEDLHNKILQLIENNDLLAEMSNDCLKSHISQNSAEYAKEITNIYTDAIKGVKYYA